MNKTDKSFFPTSKKFWALHLGCWGSLYFFLIFTQFLSGAGGVAAQAVGGLLYVGLGAFGGLLYRYLFHALGWNHYSVARMTGVSAIYALIDGLFVGFLVMVYIIGVKMFAPQWLTPTPQEMPDKTFYLLVLISNAINIAIFQALWSAIYIATQTYRRSLQREIEALRLENSLKEAQLSTLSSQLNPHFLFNALNNIRFMMRKDVDNAEEMLTNLSELLRYALESSRSQLVDLNRELETLESYLSLVQLQFSERLNYQQHVDQALGDCMLPPMMLQMLVENAVKHGMDELKEGGCLALSVTREQTEQEDSLCVRVENEFNTQAKKLDKAGFGIGLGNIEKRLQLIYSDKASLRTRAEGQSWTAELRIPIAEQKEAL